MANIIALAAALFALFAVAYVFVNSPPAAVANALRLIIPLIGVGLGLVLVYAGRASLGIPLLLLSAFSFMRARSISAPNSGAAPKSTVRSAWLEMQLDHETGDLDGFVLTGAHEGETLASMDSDTLLMLYADLSGDSESAALMEAYLDRRIPSWRDRADTNTNTRAGEAFSSGAMSKEEAYQVLGLEPGATEKDVRSAHRRLMKSVHPDSGGSTFLAARINQAKDTLLD